MIRICRVIGGYRGGGAVHSGSEGGLGAIDPQAGNLASGNAEGFQFPGLAGIIGIVRCGDDRSAVRGGPERLAGDPIPDEHHGGVRTGKEIPVSPEFGGRRGGNLRRAVGLCHHLTTGGRVKNLDISDIAPVDGTNPFDDLHGVEISGSAGGATELDVNGAAGAGFDVSERGGLVPVVEPGGTWRMHVQRRGGGEEGVRAVGISLVDGCAVGIEFGRGEKNQVISQQGIQSSDLKSHIGSVYKVKGCFLDPKQPESGSVNVSGLEIGG